MERAFTALQRGEEAKMDILPRLLSIWSGIECPIDYNTIMNDNVLEELENYINKLSEMSWEKGSKYFYSIKL